MPIVFIGERIRFFRSLRLFKETRSVLEYTFASTNITAAHVKVCPIVKAVINIARPTAKVTQPLSIENIIRRMTTLSVLAMSLLLFESQ